MRGAVEEALRFIEGCEPDVLFNYAAQTWTTDSCLGFLAQPRRFAQIFAPCGFSALREPSYAPYFARLKALLPLYDSLVFHSTITQDWEFAADPRATKMHVIPNGADDPGAKIPRPDPRPLCLTVGSHVRSKGHRDFVRAIKTIARQRPIRGAIVAPPRVGLEFIRGCQARCSLSAATSRDLVELRDGRAPGVVESTIAEADLFLFPSTIECAPLVILEAMAAGVPWISYDVGNVRELDGGLVVGSYGELVRPRSRCSTTRLDGAPRERRP